MDRLALDVRLALRRLRQNPGFSVIAIVTLALGIGANTAVFSLLNAIFFRPLPAVVESSRLVAMNETLGGGSFPTVSYPNYRDIRDRMQSVTGLASYRIMPANVGLPGSNQRVWGYLVTGNYFDVLGVKPYRGRLIGPGDDVKPGGHPVAVLTYNCWLNRFGGNTGAIGSSAKFNGQTFTILGVTPPEFIGTELFYTPDVFVPMMMQREMEGGGGYLENRGTSNTMVTGRLKPGVTPAQAQSELDAIARRLSEQYPKDNGGMKLTLSPVGLAGNYIRGAVIGFAAVLFGISCLLLLIACTNLASLLLARAADRRRDTAVRLALGAGRGVLIRQLLTENLVMSLAGGAGGALMAFWITDALRMWKPPIEFPLVLAVHADWRVFFFALLVSTVTVLLFGLVPALQSSRLNLLGALKNESASERGRRWHMRDYMVATQVGLSAILLVCSVLVVRSLQKALDAPIGFNARNAVEASIDLNLGGYKEAQGRAFERRFLAGVRAIPGVESAATTDWLPLSLNNSNDGILIEGKPVPKAADMPIAMTFVVSTDYFRTMQTRIVSGREFDVREREGGPRVAVVNQAFAAKLLPGEDPIGKRFMTGVGSKPIEIIGVAEDGKYFSLNEDRNPAIFLAADVWYSSNLTLIARSQLPAEDVQRRIQAVVREMDPSLALFGQMTLTRHLDLPLFPARAAASALGAFGMLVMLLAATGIYGVMAYAVSRRTREIGIRMAIGATPRQVLGSVARSGAILVGSGTLVGLVIAFALGRLLKQILYGVEPTDPVTFLIVALMMASIAALACWLPARRATRINPLGALRQD